MVLKVRQVIDYEFEFDDSGSLYDAQKEALDKAYEIYSTIEAPEASFHDQNIVEMTVAEDIEEDE